MAGGVRRAFKYRFYPTDVQAVQLSRTFGCVRKVYNVALAARSEAWAVRRDRVGYHQTSAMLTGWKKTEDLAFLAEVSCVPLQQALRHLQGAFVNFFAQRAGYPRFKAKHRSRASAEYTRSAFTFRDGRLTLAKMGQPLDIVWSRPLPDGYVPTTVTVSRDAAGRWFVSLLCDDPSVVSLPAVDAAAGIDVGLEHLVILSTGQKIANPRYERNDRARLARAQQALSRKARGEGANWAKARRRVAKIHARIANRRRDHLHQLSTHDRDVNAAKNLLAAGLAVSVCGADVRPQRKPPDGQSAMKQKPHGASRRNPPRSRGGRKPRSTSCHHCDGAGPGMCAITALTCAVSLAAMPIRKARDRPGRRFRYPSFQPGIPIVALLGIGLAVTSLCGTLASFQGVGGLVGGTPGTVAIADCSKGRRDWNCRGEFRSADGRFTIPEVSITIGDDARPRPGDQVAAKVIGPAADRAVRPGHWGDVLPFLIMSVGLGAVAYACLKKWWSTRSS